MSWVWNRTAARLVDPSKKALFEELILPHLDAAHNLARWLTRNPHDAQDVVQESYLRALQFFHTFQIGRDGRVWLLKIVRNTCYSWLRKNRGQEIPADLDPVLDTTADLSADPEQLLIDNASANLVRQALEHVPLEYREVIVLRELEDLPYKTIAQIVDIPLGTVMSRLSRGRKELRNQLMLLTGKEGKR